MGSCATHPAGGVAPLDFVTLLCYTGFGGGSMFSFGALLATAHWPPEVLAKLLSPEKTSFAIPDSSTSSGKSQGARRRVRTVCAFIGKPVLLRRRSASRTRYTPQSVRQTIPAVILDAREKGHSGNFSGQPRPGSACLKNLDFFPPHPDPLPKGEGD